MNTPQQQGQKCKDLCARGDDNALQGVHNLGNPIPADSSDVRSGNSCNGEADLQRKKQ